MKKKKVFSKILAVVLVLSLMFTTVPSFSVFAQEVSSKEQLTKKGELWQPETNPNELNFEGDLSLEELKTAELAAEDTPEIVSQDSINENGHVNRLWEQEEDLNSIVFQNRDGTKTMYYYNYPVKYKDKNGKIKDKSNEISLTSDGDFTNAENDINTYFPKKLNKNKGIELKFDEYVIEMAPDIKGNSGASRQTGHNKYYDPTEYVQYPNVFDEGVSLRYTPTFEGYKEDIVLNEYTGINEFSFVLYTDGLSLAMNEDGSYYLIDPLSGDIKTQIGDLIVYDSKPFEVPDKILNESVSNPTEEDHAKKEATLKELIESVPIGKNETGELPTNQKEYFHQYKVETVKQDSEYLITVVVDEDYLTDSERVYPVYVDPTLSVETFSTGGTKNIMDAPIYANKPSTASGGNTYNVVGYQGSTYGVGRTLMKFPGLSSNSTYKNLKAEQITNLQLHIYEGSGSTNNACIDLWQYNGTSWTESTARCNNVGWDSYYNNFTWNYINCSGWQTFNLTSMVATWKSGGTGVGSPLDKGIIMTNYTSEYSSAYSKHFMSTESSYKPYLTYTYVTNIPVSQVCLEPTVLTLNVNQTYYLNASIVPSNATNKTVYYESSDTSVANVGDTSGLICASSPGTTTITAKSASDGSKVANCYIIVKDKTFDIISSLSRDEYYYLVYPSGIAPIPLVSNMPESPVISSLSWEKKLLSIPISRKYKNYQATENTYNLLKNELNSTLGTNFTQTDAIKIFAQYGLAISTIPLGAGMPAHLYTPESVEQAQSDYIGTLHTLATLVTFKIAANLNPFDSDGNIKFKPDPYINYDGSGWNYPPNDGFMNNVRESATLKPGDVISRYGNATGKFASPDGTPFSARSLPPDTNINNFHRYRVLRDIPVESGLVSPWFYQPGGGVQYKFSQSIQYYLSGSNPYLEELF